MHLANASPSDAGSPGEDEPELVAALAVALLEPELVVVLDAGVVAAPALAAVDVEVVELATFATVGLPPPHPATRTPLTSAAAASRRARGERFSLFGWLLSRILGSFWSAPDLRIGSSWRAVTGRFRSRQRSPSGVFSRPLKPCRNLAGATVRSTPCACL